MSRLRHLDLFSGIGGFALAVRWLGHETVGFCEIDEWSRRVLDKHWPEVPKHDDIRTLKGTEFGPVDLVTGGFPCQPFSFAGKRRGEEDDRHLWPAMLRIIDTARPRFVLGENVPGIINMALDGVLADLESIGYSAGAVVIPAGAVNALHRRDRVWILAHGNEDDACKPGEQNQSENGAEIQQQRSGLRDESQREGAVQPAPNPDSHLKLQECHAAKSGQIPVPRGNHSVRCGSTRPQREDAGASRAVDFGPDGLSPRLVRSRWADGSWEIDIPRVVPVADEPDGPEKLMAAGNAIVPQVAYEILREMIGEAA